MRTFLAANLGLAPYAIFWILLGVATPQTAIWFALLAAAALTLWRFGNHEFRILEAGAAPMFALLAVLAVVAPATLASEATALSFFGLGVLALLSVAQKRPWTADYARAAFAAEAESPVFHVVNKALSLFWGAMFLFNALAFHLHAPSWATTALFAFGALVSVFGPHQLIRLAILWQIAHADEFRWPAPEFSASEGLDVAIVGAGIGGLTTAALLANAGLKVAVFEAHVLAGGFCHNFLRKERRDGKSYLYRFDAGPHDFSGLFPGGPLTGVLDRLGLGEAIEWRRLDHGYVFDGERLEPARDWRDYAHQLGERFPADAAGLMSLFDDIRAIFDGMHATGETTGGIPGMPTSVEAMLAFPKRSPMAVKWMDRPFDELVALHIRGAPAKNMILALTGYISDGRETLTCAQMVPLFGYYFHGGYYPVGGSEKLAQALISAIESRGGEVHLKTRVERILVEDGRAGGLELANGQRVSARAVVSNADIKRTFGELVAPSALPPSFYERMKAADPAPSAFMVHLGVDYVPDGPPAWHVHGPESVGVEVLSKVDPSAAPAGHSTVGIIKILSADEARKWFPEGPSQDWKALRLSNAYQERKREIGDRMILAAETVLPTLRDHIIYRSEATPVTYARYDHSSAGAIYGVARQGRLRGAKSPVTNLVVAGAATHGPGVEAVVISGARAAEALVPGLLARSAAT